MVSPAVAPSQPSASHQYGTRIRSNSVIRPSARLRQSPDIPPPPRRIKPVPTPKPKPAAAPSPPQPDLPVFPPPHIMLHSDDSGSKVFVAIGRSFMSVNNCAMTIKDLAEMTMKFGLMCQNVSAAGQAITTYIRNHLQRCEVQQDHPLLLRHVMSGTPSDDELVSALHSRVGGAHCMLSPGDSRITNFRRGTMVWYLSKAAGAPCPFARVGIRLSEYSENGKVGNVPARGQDRKRERDRLRRMEQCGQKRKRLLRSCADRGTDFDSSSEEEKRPPKVKLTLRLKPRLVSPSDATGSAPSATPSDVSQRREVIDLSQDSESESESDSDSDSDSDSMSLDPSPSPSPASPPAERVSPPSTAIMGPYLRRSISIPCYTPSLDSHHPVPSRQSYGDRRSPSVPVSITSATPPPDSEDEDDDFHISMTGVRRAPRHYVLDDDDDDEDMTWDEDLLADLDADTEASPGPRSPSAQFEDEVTVKQEPSDVRGFLDAWEGLETSAVDMKVLDVVAQAAAGTVDPFMPKSEEVDTWDWSSFGSTSVDHFSGRSDSGAAIGIKQEEEEFGLPFFLDRPRTPPELECMSPVSPVSPASPSLSPVQHSYFEDRRHNDLHWRNVELLGPDSVQPHDFEDSSWQPRSGSSAVSTSATVSLRMPSTPSHARVSLPPSLNLKATAGAQPSLPEVFTPSLISSLTSLSLRTPTTPEVHKGGVLRPVSAACDALEVPDEDATYEDGVVVISPCEAGMAAVVAMELEGIWVYGMTVGSARLLRRVDSDFVNATLIMKAFGLPYPISPRATLASGSPCIRGTWLPLDEARVFAKGNANLAVFLSDDLPERLPIHLQAFRHQGTSSGASDQFGALFQSTVDARRHSLSLQQTDSPYNQNEAPWEKGMITHLDVEDHIFSVHPAYTLDSTILSTPLPEETPHAPLTPSEEAMFDSFCTAPDWETSAPPDGTPGSAQENLGCADTTTDATKETSRRDRPLRRSKRVANANAIATRSRTRSSKRGSRSSLS